MERDRPLVSVVIPIRNEAAHIGRALDAIDRQTYPRDRIDIIVVDGGSTDGTRRIVEARARTDPRIRLLGGPGVNTPLAMNLGIEAAHGSIIAKIDGHGWVDDGYLETAVDELEARPAVGCVGGRVVPEATTSEERAIGYARFSRLGVGTGIYTLGEREQLVDTVQCGVYRLEALQQAGTFDPSLQFGEDEEVNHRLRQAGWQILLIPRMQFTYRVRPDLASLFRQYFRYGRARVAVVRKHPDFLRPKHAVPALLVLLLGGSLAGAAVAPARGVALAPWVGYAGTIGLGALALAVRHRFARPDLIAGSYAALHLGYGLGTLRGLFDSSEARG